MPSTRRSSGPRSAAATGKQSTLSFNNRVTKSVPKSAKNLSSTPAKQSPLGKHVTTPAKEEIVEPEPTVEIIDDDLAEEAKEEEPVAEPSEAELRAEKISDKQIDQYWRKLERERMAKRVHQEDLTQAEKILRYFDVSSQYGPCVGITRMKRWQRADRLGLTPPIEVLAVLMKEEKKGTKGLERAHMDEILNSSATAGF